MAVERLHIGGIEAKPGWHILNVIAGPGIDFVGSCTDLSRFADASLAEVYASHVLEHLSAMELVSVLREIRRALRPDGVLKVAVPDLDVLCAMMLDRTLDLATRLLVMNVMYGGGANAYDYHRVGLNLELLGHFAGQAGFATIRRVADFGLFVDTSRAGIGGRPISLNVEIRP